MGMISIVIGLVAWGIGLGLVGLGAYLLYQSFQDEEGWFTSPAMARVIGIVAVLLGVSMLCAPLLVITYLIIL